MGSIIRRLLLSSIHPQLSKHVRIVQDTVTSFFLSYKNRPNWTKVIPSERKGGSIGCSGCVPGANGSKAHNAPPKLFLSTLAILVSGPCEALKKNQLKSKSYVLILIAHKQSAHACTACIGGGANPPLSQAQEQGAGTLRIPPPEYRIRTAAVQTITLKQKQAQSDNPIWRRIAL